MEPLQERRALPVNDLKRYRAPMSQAVHYLEPVSVNTRLPFTRSNDSSALTFDFHHLFHLLLRKWWVIALLTVFSIGAAVLYLMKAPKIYQSTAVVEVESKS